MSTTGSAAKLQLHLEGVRRFAESRLEAARAQQFGVFLGHYFAHTGLDDLAERRPEDLYGAAMAHLSLARQRMPGEALVRVYAPDVERHGYASPHTVVEIVTDDMPFLVDSVAMELTRRDLGLHLVVHPVLRIVRDTAGELTEVLPTDESREGAIEESFLRFEIDRQEGAAATEIRDDLVRVLGDVRVAVEDWRAMRQRADEIAVALADEAPTIDPAERKEVAALIDWLLDKHFIFLGYREYELAPVDGEDVLRSVEGSGLGILRDGHGPPSAHRYSKLPPAVRRKAREANLLNMTKANSRSTVHRRNYLDYIGVKKLDAAGNVVAERRFLGLYTTSVYKQWPHEIPILRRSAGAVIERAGFASDSHSGKALVEILDSYPRDELFQMDADELFEATMTILGLEDRQRLRLLVRHDQFGRFVSCLVFLPRNRLTPVIEQRIQDTLREAFHGVHLEKTTTMTESVLVRLHLTIYVEAGSVPEYDASELEAQLAGTMRSWSEDLRDALVDELGEEHGNALHRRYGGAFTGAYMEDVSPRAAVSDIRHIEALGGRDDFSAYLYRPLAAPAGSLRLKMFRAGRAVTLSAVLPVLENMGLQVADERPYEVQPTGRDHVFVYDFGLAYAGEIDLDLGDVRERFHDAFGAVCRGQMDNDSFNRLVLGAGLDARQVEVLRTYARYLRQAGTTSGQAFMAACLTGNPRLASLLVELFQVRFDPDLPPGDDRELAQKTLVEQFELGLDAVVSLNEDRVLRRLLATVLATLRTNFFQRDSDGALRSALSIKLDSRLVPDLPLPRPMVETFVYSPRVEGIHLRAGRVARGGIRWSDRLEDYRTEVLGLMKAQNVKNAVIVPVGAKGGFVVKSPPTDPEAIVGEGIECYRIFIHGLLELTDNLVAGEVEPPPRTVRHDEDDPYLVVAADKGTASFSDIANALAVEQGFWLGDAFASGGSTGYDHKAMGITARGGWVSVQRHLRQLGIDPARDGLRAVGVGDMSGDVFGNGMLLDQHMSLLAAFDHRHVFLDPHPDSGRSHAERQRLFDLPRSSWADYETGLISPGGGVFPRSAKSIPLSPEMRQVLDIEAESLTPDELIRAILCAPVDLLWNGGIGTYVRSSDETNSDVGDKSNDNVRVTAAELRCRCVGEGGNLGFTQLGRIEYALAGGLIFTDAIDNSAGVDCSDHEVNIKILLDRVVVEGSMTNRQRNELLVEMTDEVADHVLADNEGQTRALTIAAAQAHSMASVHVRLLSSLERSGRLNRSVEYLPTSDELQERITAGAGLTTPELAVLLAYAKSAVYGDLLASDLPEDPFLARQLSEYFPVELGSGYAAQLSAHPLRREIIATRLTNTSVNLAGMTFVHRMVDETGLTTAGVIRSHMAAVGIFDIERTWDELDRLGQDVPARVQVEMFLTTRGLAERAARWLLNNRPQPLDIAAVVDNFAPQIATLASMLPDLVTSSVATTIAKRSDELVAASVPIELAARIASMPALLAGLDMIEVAQGAGKELDEAAAVYLALGEILNLDWIRDRIAELPRDDRWQALARAALREDLTALRTSLTAAVLGAGSAKSTGAERVRKWCGSHEAPSSRCRSSLDDIVAGGKGDLATLSVALREIRALAREAANP